MFGSLFRRAQATVDHAVGQMLVRILVAIPFLIAAGFGTAAISMRLNREYGAETGSIILAIGFAVVGLLTALAVYLRSPETPSASEEPSSEGNPAEAAAEPDSADFMSGVDRELLSAALTSVAPLALPGLMRMVLRNLPLLAAVGAAAFVISRSGEPGVPEPGE